MMTLTADTPMPVSPQADAPLFAAVYVEESYSDRAFLYSIPEELSGKLSAGVRVLVPFGRGKTKKREKLGIVASLVHSAPPDDAPSEVLDMFDNGVPVLSPDLMRLAEWVASYYISTPIEAVSAALPAALRIRPKEIITLPEFQLSSGSEKIVRTWLRKEILRALHREKKLTTLQLEKRVGSRNLSLALSELSRAGLIEIKKSFEQKGKPKFKQVYRLVKAFSEEELENIFQGIRRSKKQTETLSKIIALGKPEFFADDLKAAPAALQSLVAKQILTSEKREVTLSFLDSFSEKSKRIVLTEEQQVAVRRIEAAIESKQFRTLLLHGVTGSGKTWLYIEAIKRALAQGRTAIVLVPEISLTPQTASRFRTHFGDDVRVLHSAMNDSEKYEAWESLRQGRARIALGPRSAVFAPLPNLGVIIVDEEHESSYKQFDKSPRYHARDTAIMRAKFENAVCILGSATPSVESYHNAMAGKYELLTLKYRADGAAMPEMKLIAVSKDRRASYSVSETLYTEIKTRLEKDEQVILFQNRRGFSGSVQCGDCGHIYLCSSCQVPMVYHLKENHLRCHYCGKTDAMISKCVRCDSEKLLMKSSGTERIEQELATLFPDEKILRMDLDTTSKKDSHAKILKEFGAGKARILLGTQMVAKGLDFPNVTLVGVLTADIGLTMPDFRASERVYSLLMQVAGRAGRAQKKGEVFLQVYNLDSDVFRLLLASDYTRFYDYEIKLRQELWYPPFARLVKIEFSGKEEREVRAAAEGFGAILKHRLTSMTGGASAQGGVSMPAEMLGPVPAIMVRLNDRYRYQILVKQKGQLIITKELFRSVYGEFRQRHGSPVVRIEVDIDTQNVM